MSDHIHSIYDAFMELWRHPKIKLHIYLNLFVRYSSSRNPEFYSVLRILKCSSRTIVFRNTLFFAKSEEAIGTVVLKRKKHILKDNIFPKTLKTSFLDHFLDIWSPSGQSDFVAKTSTTSFLTLCCLTSWKVIRKKLMI